MSAPPFSLRPKRLSNADLEWEKRAEALQFEVLPSIRSTAQKWAATLGTLFALFSGLLIVKGRTDISKLQTEYQVIVGICLLVALAAAAFAVWKAAQAAQGTPEELAYLTGPRLRTWEREQAREARRRLHSSRVASIVVLVFVAAAIGMTWFGKAKPTKPAKSAAALVSPRAERERVR